MDTIAFAQMLLRRWWALVLLGLAGTAAAGLISYTQPRRYQSTVTLQLNPSAQSAFLPYTGEASPVTTLAASYREVLRSRAFGEVVVQRLQLPVEPEAIASAIKADLVPNTNILRLTVQWDHPDDAQQLAQSIAEIFITENLRRQQSQPGAQSRLAEMEEAARDMQARIESMRRQRDRLDQAVARGDLARLAELNELEARLSSLESSYASLLVEVNRARGSLNTAAILDNATPGEPTGALPMGRALAFGLLAGLAAAVGLAYLLESLDDRIRQPEEVVAMDGRAPLAVVGHLGGKRKGADHDPRLVVLEDPRSTLAEAFRVLRTNLRFVSLDRPPGILVVTSADAAEGKTLIAANLACAMAQAGARVLLVDADLRHPSVHKLFGLPAEPGLVDAVAQHAQARVQATASTAEGQTTGHPGAAGGPAIPAVQPLDVQGLWVLPAGHTPPDPGEVLASSAAGQVLDALRGQWDVVVVDTAPVGPVADTLPLAARADAVVVVARAGQTRRSGLQRALESLQPTGGPVVGVVLNDFRPGALGRYGPYGYYYYYYKKGYYPYTDGAGEASPDVRKKER